MHELPEKLPFIMIERPKMPRATWEALRTHIMRERQRKKQEQEQNQAVSLKIVFWTTCSSSSRLLSKIVIALVLIFSLSVKKKSVKTD